GVEPVGPEVLAVTGDVVPLAVFVGVALLGRQRRHQLDHGGPHPAAVVEQLRPWIVADPQRVADLVHGRRHDLVAWVRSEADAAVRVAVRRRDRAVVAHAQVVAQIRVAVVVPDGFVHHLGHALGHPGRPGPGIDGLDGHRARVRAGVARTPAGHPGRTGHPRAAASHPGHAARRAAAGSKAPRSAADGAARTDAAAPPRAAPPRAVPARRRTAGAARPRGAAAPPGAATGAGGTTAGRPAAAGRSAAAGAGAARATCRVAGVLIG